MSGDDLLYSWMGLTAMDANYNEFDWPRYCKLVSLVAGLVESYYWPVLCK